MDLGHGHYDGGKLAAPSRFRDIGLEWGSLQAAMGRMNLNIPPRTAGYAVPPRFQTQAGSILHSQRRRERVPDCRSGETTARRCIDRNALVSDGSYSCEDKVSYSHRYRVRRTTYSVVVQEEHAFESFPFPAR